MTIETLFWLVKDRSSAIQAIDIAKGFLVQGRPRQGEDAVSLACSVLYKSNNKGVQEIFCIIQNGDFRPKTPFCSVWCNTVSSLGYLSLASARGRLLICKAFGEGFMADLHPALRSSLGLLPKDRPVVLLTRHSVREMATNGIATYDLPLTPEGVALAERWGGELGRAIDGLYSSPVGRCVDTAKAMARGARQGLEVRESPTLVEPGCFVSSMRRVGPLFLELGPVMFANRHFQEQLDGVLSPEQGAAKLLRHMLETLGAPGSFSVHVTHDTILAAFIYHLMGRQHINEDDWPWMMEGAWVWFEGRESVHWLWRGQFGQRRLEPYLHD